MQELKTIWQTILEKLELTVSNVSFVMWFKPIKVLDLADNKLTISASSTSAKNQILRNYMEKLQEAVVFKDVSKQANRIKCAMIGFNGLLELLDSLKAGETHVK